MSLAEKHSRAGLFRSHSLMLTDADAARQKCSLKKSITS